MTWAARRPILFLYVLLSMGMAVEQAHAYEADDLSGDPSLPPIEWLPHLGPGMQQDSISEMLSALGLEHAIMSGGFTYTSKITTEHRDYLFCNTQLFAVIEGGFFSGKEFNIWLTTFLRAHTRHGPPTEYRADHFWGQFIARWELDDDSYLYYILRSDLEQSQGWTQQLYHIPTSLPCGGPP